VYELPVPVADAAHAGPTPYIRPLLDVLDEYERYAVALVDKEKARLFTVYLGEIEEEDRIVDFVPGKTDEGGPSQANYQRHHEAHVHRHLKRVAEQLATLLRTHPFDRLVLAGPEEATSELRRLLSRPLQARLAGIIPAEIFAGKEEILERTLEIERQAERTAEEQLVGEILELGAAGARATYGVDATLHAIWRGQVHTLAVADGLRLPGGECPVCGRLAAGEPRACPVCGSEMEPLDDVIERAIERTLDERGRVEIVHGPAAAHLTAVGGGLGALLRFGAGDSSSIDASRDAAEHREEELDTQAASPRQSRGA
jgi:peptide subunit release factor 1 (eRF1)